MNLIQLKSRLSERLQEPSVMIVVCMTSMRSSTAKPFLVLCGLSDLERNLKSSADQGSQRGVLPKEKQVLTAPFCSTRCCIAHLKRLMYPKWHNYTLEGKTIENSAIWSIKTKSPQRHSPRACSFAHEIHFVSKP